MSEPTIVARELKHSIHIPARHQQGREDATLVKENLFFSDGTIKPNIRLIKNYKRDFYVTREAYRNHKQKKETESLGKLSKYTVTQSELRDAIAKALGKPWSKESVRELNASPYVYGADISSTALLKHQFQQKYPDAITANTVCTFDIETDVINGTELPIMATVCFKNKCYTVVLKEFVKGFSNPEELFQAGARKYIQEYLDKHGMMPELYIAKDHIDLLRSAFMKVHEWKPDFLAIWNMNFDIPKVIATLEQYKVDPKLILCDPKVPYPYRVCRYKQGPNKKITASGRVIPINPAAQWHTLFLTASFYVIDAMCVYKQIRLAKQEEPSYSLDAILNKELGIRKLKFKEADMYKGLKWHQVMQTNYKIEYMIYNIFDSLSMLELDSKTKDLCLTLPTYAGISDYHDFKSQPKKIADAYHIFCLDKGEALGTIGAEPKTIPDDTEEAEPGDEDEEENSDDILSLKEWIVTLPSHMSMPGNQLIKEDPLMRTNARQYVFDADETAAYPTAVSVGNVSRATTKREIISISGIEEETFRLQNINAMFGHINAIEYAVMMFNAPTPQQLLERFTNQTL